MQPSSSYVPSPQTNIGQRFGGRTVAALVLLLLTIVLIGIVTTLAWWTFSSSSGSSTAFYLSQACSGGACTGYEGSPSLHDTFALTNDLVLGSLVLSIATLAFLLVSVFWPRWGIGTLLTGLIGSLLLLAAPLYLFASLPGALNSTGNSPVTGFFGSSTSSGLFGTTTYTWGGGSGWFMALVVFVLYLASAAIAFSAARRLQPLGDVRLQPRLYPAPGSVTPPASWAPSGAPGRFCPVCGAHYPAGTQFCSRDATPLKDVAP